MENEDDKLEGVLGSETEDTQPEESAVEEPVVGAEVSEQSGSEEQKCVFCQMIEGVIPTTKVYEDDDVLAFNDINPVAPLHVLVIPKKHIATLNDSEDADALLLGKLNRVAAELANKAGFAEEGYRVVMNCNKAAGQAVYHIHLHLLAGRQMSWPPG